MSPARHHGHHHGPRHWSAELRYNVAGGLAAVLFAALLLIVALANGG